MKKSLQNYPKKDENTFKILGTRLYRASQDEVLNFLKQKVKLKEKTLVVTPNPEFLVFGQRHPWFRTILNSAHLAIPDGMGLVLASRFLGRKPILKERVSGADLVEALLQIAARNGWQIGIVGARRGDVEQVEILSERLKLRYPGLKIQCLESVRNWQKKQWQIIFAAQGMGEQEKWLKENFPRTKASIFIGIGGSLDFLAGFSRRAPKLIRNLGLEWLWRLKEKPRAHFKRVFSACVVFPLLVLKEKLGLLKLE